MRRTIPKTILLLLVIYAFSFSSTLYRTIFYTNRPDYLLYAALGVGYLFFIFRLPFLLVEGLTLWFIWKARFIAIWLYVGQLILGILNATMYYLVAINNLELAQETYLIYRQSRGLSASSESVETILSSGGLMLLYIGTIVYLVILGALFLWNKGYFIKGSPSLNRI